MLSYFWCIFNLLSSFLVKLPTSSSISLFWNLGSFLGFIFVFQVFSGLFLVFYYSNDVFFSFNSVQYIMYEVNYGWVFRLFHFNGASLFFFVLFLHFFKGFYHFSFRMLKVWFSGLLIFLFFMMEAFMGYVLVWAQMSFWASVVITSLLSVIPFFGFDLVFWIWSGFSVSGATLKFFFVLHFLLPWLMILLLAMHLFFLHDTGSTSKIFFVGSSVKIDFFPFFWLKDFYNFFFFFFFFIYLFFFPFFLGDPEMFLEADFLNSPVHIVPEWYFLFAYAILRSIPNKMVGVIFLLFSILVFFIFSSFFNYMTILNYFYKFFFFYFFFFSIFLSWLGQCQVEPPFIFLGGLFTFLYFFSLLLIFFSYVSSFFLFLYML